jgi:hypothetical protein
MEPRGTSLGTAFGLALLIALLAGAYFLFKYIGNIFATLQPQVETLAAIASVVALLCAVIIAEGLKVRRVNAIDSITVAQRVATYERLLFFCSEPLKVHTEGSDNGQAAVAELTKLERALALHGSSRVISAYVKFRHAAKRDGDTAAPLLKALLVEMRGDLGRTEFFRKDNVLFELLSGPNP